MKAKRLTKETVVDEAVAYIEESGSNVVSLHEVARRLGIKTPSLYNHIKNTKELQYEVFQYAMDKFVAHQKKATEGKEKDEAVKAFAEAYYDFASENKGLYRLIMSMPLENDDIEKQMAVPLLDSIVEILSGYGLTEEEVAHWQRVFRAILHGFISQEDLGYFYYYDNIDLKKSRDIAVQCFLEGLHAEIRNISVRNGKEMKNNDKE